MNQAVFIERDDILGVVNGVNGKASGNGAPAHANVFQINPAAVAMVRRLKEAGFVVVVTTNQPGVSQGTVSRRELDSLHDLLRQNMPLDDILVCPHAADDDCPCRKPKPGLLKEAAFKWHLDLARSYVVSDKWQDAKAADAVNCTSLLLRAPSNGQGHHDLVRDSLEAITDAILKERAGRTARRG